MTPISTSFYPHSGTFYVLNAWGSTLIGIRFPYAVNVEGAWFAAQGNAGPSAAGVRVIGYRGGVETATTDWFTDIDTTSSWFAINLLNVDRIVIESIPTQNGGGWYGMDDFTFSSASDDDNDGLPNSWEIQYGLDPNDNGSVNPNNGGSGDPDGDGYTNLMEYGNGTSPIERTDRDGDGYTPAEGDCDDTQATASPGITDEICDGLDNNCDGRIDESLDLDGDGYAYCFGDCNDNDPFINPAAREICGDWIDNNCDGQIDDPQVCGAAMACLYDAQCNVNEYCMKAPGDCGGVGYCMPLPSLARCATNTPRSAAVTARPT